GASAQSYYTYFTTAPTADATPPAVILVTPGNGATNVAANAPVTLTFSKPLDPSTISTNNFALFAGSTRLSLQNVTASDYRTVILNGQFPTASTITVVATHDVKDL